MFKVSDQKKIKLNKLLGQKNKIFEEVFVSLEHLKNKRKKLFNMSNFGYEDLN